MMYMLRDVDVNDATQFSNCGLVGPKGDWTPKKSWYYVSTLKRILAGTVYDGEMDAADPNVLIYKFKSTDKSSGVYALWAKTSENYVAHDFVLNLPQEATDATAIELTPGDSDGVERPLIVRDGGVTVDVTERPLFVRIDRTE